MTEPTFLHRAASLGLLLIAVAIPISSAGLTMAEAWTSRQQASQTLALSRQQAASNPVQQTRFRASDISVARQDAGEALIALQRAFNLVALRVGAEVRSSSPMPSQAFGEVGDAVWLAIQIEGDVQALVDLLQGLDAERPAILVRRLEILTQERSAQPDVGLRIQLEVGQIWRPAQPAPQEALPPQQPRERS